MAQPRVYREERVAAVRLESCFRSGMRGIGKRFAYILRSDADPRRHHVRVTKEEAMVTIMCSSKLHTALSEGGALECEAGPGPTVRLGDWAAIAAGGDLLIAIEVKTCLTLVTRIRPVAGLRDRLVASLRHALVNGGVSPEAIEPECTGIRRALFVRGRNPALAEALGFAQIEGQAHVEGGQDEASVQDMLNEYPYGECPASCPTEAVAILFQPADSSS